MKKIFIQNGLLLSATVLLALGACSKNNDVINDDNQNEDKRITETLSLKADTKVTLSDALALAWEDGDKIAVWTGTSDASGSFQDCAVSSDAITVTLDDASYHRFNYAVYYNGTTSPSYSAGTLSVTLPDTYDYAEVSGTRNPVPMVAKNLHTDGDVLHFYAVGALARIAVPGIPNTANKLVVTFDKDVTGSFAVSGPDTASPSIAAATASTKNVVTINLTANADYAGAVINIPVPTGTISVTKVEAKLDDAVVATVNDVITSWAATRTKGKKATAAFAPSIYSLIVAPGNLYTDSGNLCMSDKPYDHVYPATTNDVYDLTDDTKYSAYNRTYFNWNEAFIVMSSTKMPTMVQANTTQNSTDGYTKTFYEKSWHMPSYDELIGFMGYTVGKSGTIPARPGAKVTVYAGGSEASISPFSNARYAKVTLTDYEDGTPKNAKASGLIIFPDNVEITLNLETLAGTLNAKGSKFSAKTITKANLDALIGAGCAFLDANGFYNNGSYLNLNLGFRPMHTYSEDASNFTRLGWTNTDNQWSGSTTKNGFWLPIRLVRPVE